MKKVILTAIVYLSASQVFAGFPLPIYQSKAIIDGVTNIIVANPENQLLHITRITLRERPVVAELTDVEGNCVALGFEVIADMMGGIRVELRDDFKVSCSE